MNHLIDFLFVQIPMMALLCNIFLLCTMLSAKKDASIVTFIGLLTAFIMWAGGAFFMRCQLYPDVTFWWKVSLSGIFTVPYLYFLLFSFYTEQRGKFLRIVFGIITVIMLVMNLFDAFMTTPEVTMTDGILTSHYDIKWLAVLPIIFTVWVFVAIGLMLRKTLAQEDMPLSYLMPLFVGILLMLVGIALNVIFNSVPMDTLGCALNSVCIYYAFYKKRFYALNQITSKGSMYVISILITALTISAIFPSLDSLVFGKLETSNYDASLIVAVICSAVAILLFIGLNKLHDGLFVREQLRREEQVHIFTTEISSTLHTGEILQRFADLVKTEIDVDHMYICMYDSETETYVSDRNVQSLERLLEFKKDHPMMKRLSRGKGGMLYSDFKKTMVYKSMWESEKHMLESIHAAYILPFSGENGVLGFTILSEKLGKKKNYTYAEISFLESIASVASIALKNAMLYQVLEKEALLDPLTGLLNRRTLNKKVDEQFEKKASPITLVLLNLDDFSLYNELYGSEEGDRMLKDFAKIMERAYGDGAILARYGGKEFAALLPYCDGLSAYEKTVMVRDTLADSIANSRERMKKFLTFSAGICSYPANAVNGNQLISYANMEVFQIKQNGKNQIRIFDGAKADLYKDENSHGEIHELTSTIYALTAAIDAKDHYTFNHSQCVSKYASALAERAGMPADHVEIVRQAGLLHDIGKIGIPDGILRKNGGLTPEEFSIMRQHVERSIEMIRHLPSLDYVIPAVLGHHERFDGKGYPRGIAGEDIPVSARCLTIADSFDAMVSKRSYKNKMPVEDALMEIERNLGTQFDPQLGRIFIDMVKNDEIKVVHY